MQQTYELAWDLLYFLQSHLIYRKMVGDVTRVVLILLSVVSVAFSATIVSALALDSGPEMPSEYGAGTELPGSNQADGGAASGAGTGAGNRSGNGGAGGGSGTNSTGNQTASNATGTLQSTQTGGESGSTNNDTPPSTPTGTEERTSGPGQSQSVGNRSGLGEQTRVPTATKQAAPTPTQSSNNEQKSPTPTSSGSDSGSTRNNKSNGTGGSGSVSGISLTSTKTEIGGPLSLSRRVLYTVASPRPAYWRTGAYVTYTGGGWARSTETEPFPAGLDASTRGSTLRQRFTVKRSFPGLPAAWVPGEVGENVDSRTRVTKQGGLRVTEPLAPNETYSVTSHIKRPSPGELEQSGREHPQRVQRYTTLPSSVPSRVKQKTDDITAGADNQYETAVAIEDWLEADKEYSLNASDPSGGLADAFIFELEKGYCAYFASTMVVMLRTQDIPARYTTGFSPGQPVDNDTYVVRALNAHAWVEVYFPETGWVRFDPTPGGPRLQSEQAAVNEARQQGNESVDTNQSEGTEYAHNESGSPDEYGNQSEPPASKNKQSDTSSDSNESSTRNESTSEESRSEPDYNTSLDPEPVPGKNVTVTVTARGDAVSDVRVYFNEEYIGLTNRSGQVVGQVPYEDHLNVTVENSGRQASQSLIAPSAVLPALLDPSRIAIGRFLPALSHPDSVFEPDSQARNRMLSAEWGGGISGTTTSRYYSVPQTIRIPELTPNNSTTRHGSTYSLPTTISVRLVGPSSPGRQATVVATIEGVPVRNGRVSIDGDVVGETNDNGRLNVTLPFTKRVKVNVSRGDTFGQARQTVDADLDVKLRNQPRPGQRTTLVARINDRSLPNATAFIDGERIGLTGSNGTTSFTVPYRQNFSLEIRRGEFSTKLMFAVDSQLTVSVDGRRLPFQSVTITAMMAGRAIPNATVSVHNETVGATGPDGSESVSLPLSNTAPITVRRGEFSTTRTLTGLLFLPLAGLLLLIAVLSGGIVTWRYNLLQRLRDITVDVQRLRELLQYGIAGLLAGYDRLRGWGRAGLARLLAGFVFIGIVVTYLSDRIRAVIRMGWRKIRAIRHRVADVLKLASSPRTLLAVVATGLRTVPTRIRILFGRLWTRIAAVGRRGPPEVGDERLARGSLADSTAGGGQLDVRAAWATFGRRLPLRNRKTITPGEMARTAISEGFPRDSVRQLTTVFREVEYGEYPQTEARQERAVDALRHIVDDETK